MHKTHQPKILTQTKHGVIADFGETISGFIDITFTSNAQKKVTIVYSEGILHDKINFESSFAGSVGLKRGNNRVSGGRGAPAKGEQKDIIYTKTGKNHFRNKFCYHSFRFAVISGITSDEIQGVSAMNVHTNLQQIGQIYTDNWWLNELFAASVKTRLNNTHSVFEDCARERFGYGGDMVALASANLFTFDLERFNKKVLKDFRFKQTESGGIPETAPFMGIQTNGTGEGEGPILWQLVYPYLLYKHVQFYGDMQFLEQEYPYVRKQLNYLLTWPLEKIAEKCIGDHGSPLIEGDFRSSTPDKQFLGYCTLLLFLKYSILLRVYLKKDTQQLKEKYHQVEQVIMRTFENEDGTFGDKTQSSFVFALFLELGDSKRLLDKFEKKVVADDYIFNSGIFGMSLSYDVLHRFGKSYLVEKWLTQSSQISFRTMLGNGNQVLAELFFGEEYSLNHAMFASYAQWYFEALAGIRLSEQAIAGNKIILQPYFAETVDSFESNLKLKQGMIVVNWRKIIQQMK